MKVISIFSLGLQISKVNPHAVGIRNLNDASLLIQNNG